MRIEDFPTMIFIVGAPRCGTTTISDWLKQHPDICFPFVKEPHFFAQHDLTGMDDEAARTLTEREFLERFFSHCEGGQKKAGVDGSVSYLYIPERLVPALTLWPNAKFIIALRDPMAMLPSLHQRLRVTGDETIARFEDAWDAIGERAAGRRIPRSALAAEWLRYDEGGRFGTYVGRFFDLIGRERCFVSVFDDLVADPSAQYARLLDFLGLAPFEGTDFKPNREGSDFKIGWLQRLLKRPPPIARDWLAGRHFRQRSRKVDKLGQGDKAAARIFSVRKRLLDWNKKPPVKRVIPLRVQRDIRERLEPEIDRLGHLLGRDLSHWLEVREGRLG
jgi:hypothetical protein